MRSAIGHSVWIIPCVVSMNFATMMPTGANVKFHVFALCTEFGRALQKLQPAGKTSTCATYVDNNFPNLCWHIFEI